MILPMTHGILPTFIAGTFMSQVIKAFLLTSVFFTVVGCNQPAEPSQATQLTPMVHKFHGQTMGTVYHISLVAPDTFKTTALQQSIDDQLAAINKAMSTYDPNSELSLINQGKAATDATGKISLSNALYQVLEDSLSVYRHSEGRFDVTVGPLVNLWGFGPEEADEKRPSDQLIQEKRASVGSDRIILDAANRSLTLASPLYIDLSAIAKGWAVDQISTLLEANNINAYLVEIGGELRTSGQKPGNIPWKIAIEKPAYGLAAREGQWILEPNGKAVATSGDYRNYIEIDGVRFSHTIDPSTGYPITHNLASVTVVHDSCAMADAWATALNVAGPDAGMKLAESQQLAAYFIIREQNGFAVATSTAFQARFGTQLADSENN